MVLLSRLKKRKKKSRLRSFSAINDGTPIVMFDRIAEGVDCDKVIVMILILH
jgi:LacI family transcriptional regulator